jgi:hypothetical protein
VHSDFAFLPQFSRGAKWKWLLAGQARGHLRQPDVIAYVLGGGRKVAWADRPCECNYPNGVTTGKIVVLDLDAGTRFDPTIRQEQPDGYCDPMEQPPVSYMA